MLKVSALFYSVCRAIYHVLVIWICCTISYVCLAHVLVPCPCLVTLLCLVLQIYGHSEGSIFINVGTQKLTFSRCKKFFPDVPSSSFSRSSSPSISVTLSFSGSIPPSPWRWSTTSSHSINI